MIEYHSSYETPAGNQLLWRYMDAGQFLSLLTTSKLHFTRVDQFDDKWEGEAPELNVAAINQAVASGQLPPEAATAVMKATRQFKTAIFVNCWHENEDESAAMWKLYGTQSSNIALITTVDRLRQSMAAFPEPKVYCGRVKYIDYRKDHIDTSNLFNYFIHKRRSFSHEQEVRLLVMDLPVKDGTVVFDENRLISGINLDINLEQLIVQILVSPKAPAWYVTAISEVVGKYSISKSLVIRSSLEDGPLR